MALMAELYRAHKNDTRCKVEMEVAARKCRELHERGKATLSKEEHQEHKNKIREAENIADAALAALQGADKNYDLEAQRTNAICSSEEEDGMDTDDSGPAAGTGLRSGDAAKERMKSRLGKVLYVQNTAGFI